MTTEQLYEKLSVMSALRVNRQSNAELIINNPRLIPKVIDTVFMVDDPTSCRAAWVLEFACGINLKTIYPYLDVYLDHIHKVHLDSAVRPVAKICELLIAAYYSKKEHAIKGILKPEHKEKIIECCFDWMINDEKIAPKAYAMNSLYLLGKEIDWIHPELITILERDYKSQSKGYQARARQLLKLMKRS